MLCSMSAGAPPEVLRSCRLPPFRVRAEDVSTNERPVIRKLTTGLGFLDNVATKADVQARGGELRD
jgi:hypothetical protein